MSRPINQHGDYFIPAGGGRGVDIASQRRDKLDTESLRYIRSRVKTGRKTIALDLGGGFGAHAIRMAQEGAVVLMIDVAGMAAEQFARASANQGFPPGRLTFLQKDFTQLSPEDIPAGFHVLYSQRAIHFVNYRTAKELMRRLFIHMAPGGAAFVSATGYDTECGRTYLDRSKPVEDRFNHLAPDMQQKHGIEQRLVIYREQDLTALLRSAGFRDVRVWTSSFGNIKAVAKKA